MLKEVLLLKVRIIPNKLSSYQTTNPIALLINCAYFLSSDIQLRVRCKDKKKFRNEGIFRTCFKHDMCVYSHLPTPIALNKLLF